MSKWLAADSLFEIKSIIIALLNEKHRDSALLLHNVINTTPEENIALLQHIKGFRSATEFNKYCICIIIAWEESYRHNQSDMFKGHLLERYSHIPQHAKGQYLTSYQDAFYEYGLETFGVIFASIDDIDRVIRKHAGLDD